MTAGQPSMFGAQLRRYREAAGLSQEDLAERAGLTAAAIGALERGERRRPYPHTVQLLALALNLDEASRAALVSAVPTRGTSAPGAAPVPVNRAPPPRASDTRLPDTAWRSAPPGPDLMPGATGFVGRRGEMSLLQAKLGETLAGAGSVVMLVGEAGIGKTRLAREFANIAASQGAALLCGCCFEGDWQPPYGPWVEALSAYVRERAAEHLRRELGPGAAPIARLVPDVRAALPDVPLPSPLSPDDERVRLYDAVVRFTLGISEQQPVLIFLDDLHWADSESLRLLRYLVRFVRRARVLVVGAYRDPEFGLCDQHPLIGTLSVLRRESDYERLVIGGFAGEEVAEYIAQTSGRALPQALVKEIEEETGGNPFYAGEILRHLAEEAGLRGHDGRRAAELSLREMGIPEGVRQVVGRRVSHLSEDAATLLRLASGFTGSFGFEVLQALSELPDEALLDCIDEALQAGLIRPAGRSATGNSPPRYEFAHAIVRHTLYDGLNPDRRARLHRRIALALEQVRDAGSDDAAELAWQYHASAALPGAERGTPHALRAAEQAREAYAHERAAGFLRMARDLAATCPAAERAHIVCKLAVAEAEAVELERAQQSVEEALDLMRAAAVEPRECAEFIAVVVRALKEGGASPTAWEPLVEHGLALVGDTRDLLWARLALLQDHFEVLESGPIGGALWLGSDRDAIAIGQAHGTEEDYVRTLEPYDWRTRQETEAILALARTWSQPYATMRALDVAGRDLGYRFGAFHEARAVYEELLAAGERFGSIPIQGEALTHLTAALTATGDLLLARETLRREKEVIAHLGPGHRLHFATANVPIFLAYFLDGDWPSLAAAIAAFATGPIARRSFAGMIAAANAAISTCRAGNTKEARRLVEHVTSVAERAAPTSYCHSSWLASAASAVWHLQAAEHAPIYRRLLLDLLSSGAGYAINGPLELWVARMSALLGDFGEAQTYFERARGKAMERGYTHVRAIADYEQACLLIWAGMTDRPRIIELLDTALHGFQAHEMLGWAGRAAAQKRALTAAAAEREPA